MSKENTIKNYGKSIRTKLLNVAKKEDVFHQTILTRYFQERLLYRMSQIFPQTSNAEYYQKMEFGICSLTIVIFKRRSNEETENQVFGNILPLLVCPFGFAGGWSLEVPDIG